MIREKQLSPLANTYSALKVDASSDKSVVFLKELLNVEYDTVPKEASLPVVEDTRRDLMEHKLIFPNMHRVPGVSAPLVSYDDVYTFGENIDDLPLALITPLATDYYGATPLSSHGSSAMESRVLEALTHKKTGPPRLGETR